MANSDKNPPVSDQVPATGSVPQGVDELQAIFQEASEHLKQAAELIQKALGGENVIPPAAKARYESTTHIEEAYMWFANGVQSLLQFEAKAEKAAVAMAESGGNLKVIK